MGILKMEGVTHWSIPVNNLEQSEKFYGDLLGLKPLEFPSSSLPTAPRVTLREGSFISSIQAGTDSSCAIRLGSPACPSPHSKKSCVREPRR